MEDYIRWIRCGSIMASRRCASMKQQINEALYGVRSMFVRTVCVQV